MAKRDENLTEALARHGICHKPSRFPGMRELIGSDGTSLGDFDAHDGWIRVRALDAALSPSS